MDLSSNHVRYVYRNCGIVLVVLDEHVIGYAVIKLPSCHEHVAMTTMTRGRFEARRPPLSGQGHSWLRFPPRLPPKAALSNNQYPSPLGQLFDPRLRSRNDTPGRDPIFFHGIQTAGGADCTARPRRRRHNTCTGRPGAGRDASVSASCVGQLLCRGCRTSTQYSRTRSCP